jgi:hypothetical protein
MGFRSKLVATVVLAGVALATLGLLAGAGGAAGLGSDGPVPQTDVDADTVSLRVGLATDGTAAWQVTYRVKLSDENETAAFREIRDDIAADPGPYLDRFEDRMGRTVRTAENATGRDMAVENVSVEATVESLPQGQYGVVVYRLDWRGFAVARDGQIRAGDAIGGFFLDERTSLTVAWPDPYSLASHDPSATTVETNSVTWQGRRDFGPEEPRVDVRRGTSETGQSPGGDGEAPGGGDGISPALVVLVVVVVLGIIAVLYGRRGGAGPADETAGPGGDGGGPPPELLSNEERVLGLLEERGGRMKQQEVAEALDWTDAKTSQVVGDLRDADDIEAFRLGRENVLTLPDVSVETDDSSET